MRRVVLLMVALLASCGWALGQQRTVTGVVTSAEDGSTLPSVTVQIKGTLTGVATDLDGRYSITVPGPEAVLKFAYAGMETQEIQVGNQSTINVAMKVKLEEIEQAVVVGYGTRGKNQITGSTQQVGGEELAAVPTVSPEQALQGKVPGMVVSGTSGTPGSSQNILIRGSGSLSAGTQPLYVIDGVPVNSSNFGANSATSTLSLMSTLNSEDVASITMLKDASATAAYGARGSNGVIVITTKKGKQGVTKFNFSGYFGSQAVASPMMEMMTAQEQFEMTALALRNRFLLLTLNGAGLYDDFRSGKPSPETLEAVNAWIEATPLSDIEQMLLNDPGDIFMEWDKAGRPSSDFASEYADKLAPIFNGTFSARGGGETYRFYTSVGFNRTNNIVKGSNYRRVTGKMNFDKDLVKWLNFSTSNTVSYTKQKGLLNEQAAYYSNPILAHYLVPPYYPAYRDGLPNKDLGGAVYNWLFLKNEDIRWQSILRGMTNNRLEATIIPGLKLKTQLSLDYTYYDAKTFQNKIYGDGDDKMGGSERSMEGNLNYVWQNSISYSFTFLEDHQLDLMALMEFQKNKRNYLSGYAERTAHNSLSNLASMSAKFETTSSFYDWMNAAYLLMANYSYLGRYIVDATYRREGSSRFPKAGRFGNFGSIGVAWNIHAEPFFNDALEYVDRLRLRASWGVSGNSGIGLNSYQMLLSYASTYDEIPANYLSSFGNPNLTWEKNSTFDIGIDFGLFDSRIEGSFSFYNKLTYDLLQAVQISRTSGFSSYMENVGKMSNRGVELLLNFHILRDKMYHLDLGFNMGTVRNRITGMAQDADGRTVSIETAYKKTDIGHMLGEWHTVQWAGVSEETGMPLWYTDASKEETTSFYNEAEKVYLGKSAMPKYTAGLSLHADAWGAYLDMSFAYAGGHLIAQSWGGLLWDDNGRSINYFRAPKSIYNNTWSKPGDKVDYPMIATGLRRGANSASDRFLFKGDYIRMKDLTIGYNFPQSLLNRIKYEGTISIYFRATNLWTIKFDKNLEFDPEVTLDGWWEFRNPPVRVLSVGLNMNF